MTIYRWQVWHWQIVTTVKPNSAGVYKATVPASAQPSYYVASAYTNVTPQVIVVAGP